MPSLGNSGNPIDTKASSATTQKHLLVLEDEEATLIIGGWLSDIHIRAAHAVSTPMTVSRAEDLQCPMLLTGKLQWNSDPVYCAGYQCRWMALGVCFQVLVNPPPPGLYGV